MREHINRARALLAIHRRRVILIALVVCLGIVVTSESAMLFRAHDSGKKPSDPLGILWAGNYTKEREYWKKEIDAKGVAAAYELFKADTQGKEFGVAHTLAHIMGELIYEKQGIAGVASCDASFSFGCYHSLFGKAISEYGVEVVTKLDLECVKKWGPTGLGCPHGIGHGLLGSLGDEKLDQALLICATLSWKGPIGGCQSGVFMEYNYHTMQSLKGAESRFFDPAKPLYPCDAVDKKFREACYFELPAWIASVSGGFEKAGTVCDKAPEGRERDACFLGLGNSVGASTMYDAKKSIDMCGLMPSHSEMILCRAGAAWSFFAEPSAKGRKDLPCEGLSPADKSFCLQKSEIIT